MCKRLLSANLRRTENDLVVGESDIILDPGQEH